MAIPLIVNGTTFSYPEAREAPGWGSDASSWASAVTTALSSLASPTDIAQTLAVVNNNQSTVLSVQGLSFDILKVRAAFIQYSIYRSLVNGGSFTSEFAEAGTIYLVYKTGSATWELGVQKIGSSGPTTGVSFTVTPAGQIQYTSDNMPGVGVYTGQLRFSAKTFSI